MHKSYKKTVAILITCSLIGTLCCLPVSALDYSGFNDTFHMPISQPNVSENLSYMEVITRDGNGNFFAQVYLISFFATANNVEDNPFCSLSLSPNNIIGEDNKIILSDRDDFSYFTVLEINRYGDVYHYGSSLQGNVYIPWRWYEVVSLKTYGSIYVDPNSNITNYQSGDPYTISYGSDNVSLTLLNAILSTLQNQNNNDVTGAINNQTDKLQQNQNENTQQIIDNQNQIAEQEKQEISDSGNQATDAADAIPNESEGFINALGTFVNAMSTTSTECNLKFPGIKIPAIEGFFSETQLIGEQDIDIQQAVNLIPEDILKLIRALTTLGLIVFCFKELYDTISEALTRKKASSDG